MKKSLGKVFLLHIFILLSFMASAQLKLSTDSNKFDPNNPKEYMLAEQPTVTGAEHMDKNVLVLISGLTVGDKMMVPGQKITEAKLRYQ